MKRYVTQNNLLSRFYQKLSTSVYLSLCFPSGYGCTETSGATLLCQQHTQKPGSVGAVIAGQEIKVRLAENWIRVCSTINNTLLGTKYQHDKSWFVIH